MLPVLQKPADYRVLAGGEYRRTVDRFHEFQFRIQKATQQAYGRLYEVQNLPARSLRMKREAERIALEPMWDCYDLQSRAVLYLTVRSGGLFDRHALQSAYLGTHSFSAQQLEEYRIGFPNSMFQFYCDLPMTVGERYRFKYEEQAVARIEVVVEEFAFLIFTEAGDMNYVTQRENSLKLLETTDYDDDLNYDWDGNCYYIQ